MTRNSILFSIVVLAFTNSFAAVKNAQIVEGSASGFDASTPANIIVYGGYAGAIGNCTSPTSTSSTCDSCTGPGDGTAATAPPSDICTGTNYSCATRSIHPNLYFGVTMTVEAPVPANPAARFEVVNGTASQALSVASHSVVPGTGGGTLTVYVPWSAICNAADMGTDCKSGTSTSKSLDVNVGIYDSTTSSFASGNSQKLTIKLRYEDPTVNNTNTPTVNPGTTEAVTDFMVLPGDEKVYLRELSRGSTGPSGDSGIRWSAVRVFYEPIAANPTTVDFCAIPVDSAGYADLGVVTKTAVDTTLGQEFLDGLTNDQNYAFTLASVDEASIVTQFLNIGSTSVQADIDRYTAMPGEVVGLLDKQKCFIATAAFGSPMEPHVELLRNFRDQVLGKFSLGKKFIRFYYQNSPPVAEFIAQSDVLRTLVRGVLWPVILFAELALNWGVAAAVAVYAAGLAALFMLVQRSRARRNA